MSIIKKITTAAVLTLAFSSLSFAGDRTCRELAAGDMNFWAMVYNAAMLAGNTEVAGSAADEMSSAHTAYYNCPTNTTPKGGIE
jgi:hypothetical protein